MRTYPLDAVTKNNRNMIEFLGLKIMSFVVILSILSSCKDKEIVPKGYYKAQITGQACTLIAQVKGGNEAKELDKYEYIHIKNLPREVSFIGAEFYFQQFEETTPPFCLANTISPHITINVSHISMSKP